MKAASAQAESCCVYVKNQKLCMALFHSCFTVGQIQLFISFVQQVDTGLTESAWFYERGTFCMFKQVHSVNTGPTVRGIVQRVEKNYKHKITIFGAQIGHCKWVLRGYFLFRDFCPHVGFISAKLHCQDEMRMAAGMCPRLGLSQ